MTSLNIENVQKFRDYGLVLTPVQKTLDKDDKKPKTKKGKWFYDWSDKELLEANRIGAYHRESKIYDIDFDDKSFTSININYWKKSKWKSYSYS